MPVFPQNFPWPVRPGLHQQPRAFQTGADVAKIEGKRLALRYRVDGAPMRCGEGAPERRDTLLRGARELNAA